MALVTKTGPDLEAALSSLRGVALGDSLGLPYEGLPARRASRLYPLPLRQRLYNGKGLYSDDTVQSALVIAALAKHPTEPVAFQTDLAKRLKTWFATLPPGVGLSTAKACLRLLAGTPPASSGMNSAGNGAAMRSAVIGAAFTHSPHDREKFTEASARITHVHPFAIQGAQLIALAAASSATGRASSFKSDARTLYPAWPYDEQWPDRGPGGYVVPSVNAALHIWQLGLGWEESLSEVVRIGGDTDTVGAMVGGILGASGDFIRVKPEWSNVLGWPQAADYDSIRSGGATPVGRLLLAHAAGLPIVLFHGFRRLFPPY